jgi:UDP-sulfoquinovose synthase
VAETARVRDLAEMIAAKTGAQLSYVNNPRNEAAENDLEVSNRKFRLLGLDPVTLDERLFEEVTTICQKYKHRANLEQVMPTSYWNKKRTADIEARGAVLKVTAAPDASVAAAAKALEDKAKAAGKFDTWGIKA